MNEKLLWAKRLIKEKTEGKQCLQIGWDDMPVVRMTDDCMVGLYFSLKLNRCSGLYDCLVKGYIRTCGGYNPSARMKDLTEECARIADLVLQIEKAGICATREEVQEFCALIKKEMEQTDEKDPNNKLCGG